jgi:hypothetical protein
MYYEARSTIKTDPHTLTGFWSSGRVLRDGAQEGRVREVEDLPEYLVSSSTLSGTLIPTLMIHLTVRGSPRKGTASQKWSP